MQRVPFARWLPLGLAALILYVLPSDGRSAAPRPQKIQFETYDKVDLAGSWYPSTAEGVKSPCVIFVHKIGGSRQQEGWDGLAELLQDKGFAVLSFDFRGHGDSLGVRPEFWAYPHNLKGIKGANLKKEQINYKEFNPSYMPNLVNDLAAARLLVDQKNNSRECNANDIYVVAAEDGASLAMMWIATEWKRHKKMYNQFQQLVYAQDPEAKDLAAFVTLSIRPGVGSLKQLPTPLIFNNKNMRELPMCYFYGGEDASARSYGIYLHDKVLLNQKGTLKLTYKIEIENTKLAGHELLGKQSQGTDELVVKYLVEKIAPLRPTRVWQERDVGRPGQINLNPLSQVPLSSLGVVVP